jgi:hypothetical protein
LQTNTINAIAQQPHLRPSLHARQNAASLVGKGENTV